MASMQVTSEHVCLSIHNDDDMNPANQIKAFEEITTLKKCVKIATILGAREQTPRITQALRLIRNVLNIYSNDVLVELHPALVHIFTVYSPDIQQIVEDNITDVAFTIRLETLEYINDIVYLQLNIYRHEDIDRLIEMLFTIN